MNQMNEEPVTDDEINTLDSGSIRFLKALRAAEGEWLDTGELKNATQLNKDKVNYRFKKLDELSFIGVKGGKQNEDGSINPKEAHLTNRGRIALASLIERDTDELHSINQRVNQLSEDIYLLKRALDDADIEIPEN